jgi:hypothetical protein
MTTGSIKTLGAQRAPTLSLVRLLSRANSRRWQRRWPSTADVVVFHERLDRFFADPR